jgi:hypothetical protein
MKINSKKTSAFIFVVFCLMIFCMTVFATEIDPVNEPNMNDCRLTFSVIDKTNGIFTEEIKIIMMNINTYVEYNYTVTSAEYLFGITVGGYVKQGEYKIALNYANKDQFVVQNPDGTPIDSFIANSEAHTFNWVIVSKSGDESPQKSESDTQSDYYNAKTDNPEADEVWNNFLKSVSVFETDSKYAGVLKYYETTKNNFARTFAEMIEGKTEEDYLNMTPFERFLWYATYVRPISASRSKTYEVYFGSIDKWNSNVIGGTYGILKNQGAREQAEAYKKLMEWQYNYFMQNGEMYNFMTGKSSIEENSKLEPVKPDNSNKLDQDPTIEEIKEEFGEEIQKLVEKEMNSTKADKGIWSDTIALLKSNALTIVILLILVGATIGVVIYRKRKAIDDDIEG